MPLNKYINPEYSVIMNCHNSDQYLTEAIDSVYEQSYGKWEIIFYDNASTDDSAKIAKSYDDRLNYIFNEEKLPLGEARNAAITHANGKYIAFLDCDDVWYSKKLELQREAFRSADIGLCYSDSMRIDANGNNLILYSHEKRLLGGDIYCELIIDCFIDMSTCVVLASALRDINGFDNGYKLVEDWDVWLKIAKEFEVALVDQPLVKTRLHVGNVSSNLIEHCDEMMHLINNLDANEPRVVVAVEAARKIISMRRVIFIFAQSLKKKSAIISSLSKLIVTVISCPLVAYRIAKRNLNVGMLKLFRIRALGNNGDSTI